MALSSAATHLNVTRENRDLSLSLRIRISCIKNLPMQQYRPSD